MTIATQYARALHQAVRSNPDQSRTYLANLRQALKRRGHEKLLPNILRAYEHLDASEARRKRLSVITPEMRRTRMLVELYKKLINA